MGIRILVVDDDPLVLRGVERILLRAGYEVVAALTRDTAERALLGGRFDAAIVDQTLSRLGGDEGLALLGILRDTQPGCVRILMTAKGDLPGVLEAANRGEVAKVVRKPFDARGLLDTIRDAFESVKRASEVNQDDTGFHERAMLDDCIARGLLELAIQPIVRTGDLKVIAYEALLRSKHPVLDGPASLLRAAVHTHAIPELGQEVFRLAALKIAKLPPDIGLFVNLHSLQLADREGLAAALAPLLPYSKRIAIEITEQGSLYDIPGWDLAIQLLDDLGFSLAVDDLGAGHNSLAMLADLQPKYVKLDMSLIRNVDREPRKQRLVSLIATFCSATGAQMVAEGVETPEEAATVVECGSHLLQGFHFGRPTTVEA